MTALDSKQEEAFTVIQKSIMVENENATRFALSGISCMSAGIVTNPIDVIKVRLQLDNELSASKSIFADRKYRGFFQGGIRIVQEEGVRGLYKGVYASALREGVYSTIRLGLYEPFKELFGEKDRSKTPLYKKIMSGALSGSIGSAIANPTDLVKIRLQAEGKLEPGQTPRYKSTFDAFAQISRKEGVRGLWRGVGPTVQRAAIITASQIPSYDHTKHALLNNKVMHEGLRLHFVSSMVAGLVCAIVTSPVDVIKTRIMNQKIMAKENGLLYKSTLDCLYKTLKFEGILGLYKGFIPNWMRIGPHTIITFLIFEQLRKIAGLKPL
eukprot:gene9542-17288_t